MKDLTQNLKKYLSIAVVSLSIVTLIICFFSPVYTDEVLWKAIQGRYWQDGNQALSLTLFPSCGPYSYHVPTVILPFRIFTSWLYNFSSPLFIRLFGVSLALLWLFITWVLFCNITINKIKKSTIALCLIAFATLGVLPFLLTLSRPEQLLLLCMTIFFVPLLKENSTQIPTTLKTFFYAISIIFLAAFMLTIHPKAIFALPLIFLFIYRFIKHKWFSIASMIAVTSFGAISFHDWSLRWTCGGDPVFATALRGLNLGSNTNLSELKIYFSEFIKHISYANSWYIIFATPKPIYVSSMLPAFYHHFPLVFGRMLRVLLTYTAGIAFLYFIYSFFKNRRNVTLRVSYAAIGAIWLFYGVSVVTRIYKNDYEATLIVPLLALAVVGSIWIGYKTISSQRYIRSIKAVFLSLLLLSVVSQIFSITNYIPYMITSWSSPGYTQGQHYSISNFGYAKLRPVIIEAAAKCGIHTNDHLHHLVVDELTYFTFRESYQPFFMATLDDKGWGRHRPDPTQLLTNYNSAGMIVGCQWIPAALKAKAIQYDQFCCLPAFL